MQSLPRKGFGMVPPYGDLMPPSPRICETYYMLRTRGCGIEVRRITTELGTEKVRATMLVLNVTVLASVIGS